MDGSERTAANIEGYFKVSLANFTKNLSVFYRETTNCSIT
jgi:hypothetical protein